MKIKKLKKDTKSISVGVFIPTGSAYEKENERGLAHFIEHMLFKGTKNRGYKEIAEDIDKLGGVINAFTSKEYTCFYIKVLKDFIDDGFDVLKDMISSSTIDARELEKEKNVIIEEINMTEDNPDEAAFEYFMKNAIDGSFGWPILGTREHIKSYKREDLLKFMGKYYKPEDIIISVVGDVEDLDFYIPDDFSFKNFFSNDKNDNMTFRFNPGKDVIHRDIQQSNVVLGCELFDIFDERKYTAYLLNDIFGGTMSSILFQSIREEKSLCYHISSSVRFFKIGGFFSIFAGTYKDNTQKLLDAVKEEIEKLKKEYISKDILEKAKTHFKGSYMLSLESSYSLMVKQGIDTILYGDYLSEFEIIDKVCSVSLDDMVNLIDLIDLDKFHVTVLGDIDKITW